MPVKASTLVSVLKLEPDRWDELMHYQRQQNRLCRKYHATLRTQRECPNQPSKQISEPSAEARQSVRASIILAFLLASNKAPRPQLLHLGSLFERQIQEYTAEY